MAAGSCSMPVIQTGRKLGSASIRNVSSPRWASSNQTPSGMLPSCHARGMGATWAAKTTALAAANEATAATCQRRRRGMMAAR